MNSSYEAVSGDLEDGEVSWSNVAVFLLCCAAIVSVVRGFSGPLEYAFCQWFATWEFGYVKRGLIGTAVSPLMEMKTGAEIVQLITLLATAALMCKLVCLGYLCRGILFSRGLPVTDVGYLAFSGVAVFATSSYLVFTSHCSGFYDHFLEIITLGCVAAIHRRMYVPVILLSIIALSIHEMFALYGLPVVTGALIMQLFFSRPDFSRGRAVRIVASVLVPIAVAGILMLLSQRHVSAETIEAIENRALHSEAVSRFGIENMVSVLKENITESWRLQRVGTFAERLVRGPIILSVYPVVIYLLAMSAVMLYAARRLRALIIVIPAALSPLLIHLIAWDTERFANFMIFHCLVFLHAILRSCPVVRPISPMVRRILYVAGALICLNSLLQPVELMADRRDGLRLLVDRPRPLEQALLKCDPLFDNSTFDRKNLAHWTGSGDAFQLSNKIVLSSAPIRGSLGAGWLSSYSLKKNADDTFVGDITTGELLSKPFRVVRKSIVFLVGGGKYSDETYVSLLVDQREVYRASGNNADRMEAVSWDMRPFFKKNAQIKVVDRRSGPWGHINADQFCWSE